MPKIIFKHGTKSTMPKLDFREPGITDDTEEFFIGGNTANIQLAKQSDLDTTNTNKADKTYVDTQTGDLNTLQTTDKSNLVNAVNENVAHLAQRMTSITQHGATGGSNDSTAFQAANDYLVSKGGDILYVPPGTWYANFIRDSNVYIKGAGVEVSIIKSVAGSNKDVIQGRDFATLTGTSPTNPDTSGVHYAGIKDITIDGNRSNNTSGFGIREWGSSWYWDNVIVQNCVNDGIWTEFSTIATPNGDTSYQQALESNYRNIKSINNGGNGWTYHGPHDGNLENYVSFNNTGWAFYQGTSLSAITGSNWNSWLNGNSYYVGTSIKASKVIASASNVGTGIEFALGSGGSRFTDLTVDGHATGAILRGSNVKIEGEFGSNVNDAVVFDGVYGSIVDIVGAGNGNVFKINAGGETGTNFIRALMDIPAGKTVLNGSFGQYDTVFIFTSDGVLTTTCQLPSATLKSPNGWSPVLPQSNGVLSPFITGAGVPTSTPDCVGEEYLDTTNKKLYKAFGTSSSADWVIMN